MKFFQSCMIASMAGVVSNAADISVVLEFFETDMLNDETFQKAFLLNLQRDTTNTDSDCMAGYTMLQEVYATLSTNLESDADYLAGLAAKGQADGTSYGYALSKFESYIDMATVSTNLFNECDLDYYLMAVSKAVSNVAGFINQAINTYFRMNEGTVYDDMETAFEAEDSEASAILLATFIQDFLMAEIPDKSQAGYYQSVGQLM